MEWLRLSIKSFNFFVNFCVIFRKISEISWFSDSYQYSTIDMHRYIQAAFSNTFEEDQNFEYIDNRISIYVSIFVLAPAIPKKNFASWFGSVRFRKFTRLITTFEFLFAIYGSRFRSDFSLFATKFPPVLFY